MYRDRGKMSELMPDSIEGDSASTCMCAIHRFILP